MDDALKPVKEFFEGIGSDKLIQGLFIVIVLVYIFYMLWLRYTGNSFTDPPVAAQRPPTVIGVGTYSPYQSGFSSTNQGSSNLFADSVTAGTSEGLVGAYEAPIINQISNALDAYQYSQGQIMDAQGTISSTPANTITSAPTATTVVTTTPAATPAAQSFANMKGRSGLFMQSFANPNEQRLMNSMLGGN